jgi:hypothetical protein
MPPEAPVMTTRLPAAPVHCAIRELLGRGGLWSEA